MTATETAPTTLSPAAPAEPSAGAALAARPPQAGAGRVPVGIPFLSALPVRLDVKIPVPNFRFKDLAGLEAGRVLVTDWPVAEDLPVAAGEVRMLWAEFAVADQRLTVRVTRVA